MLESPPAGRRLFAWRGSRLAWSPPGVAPLSAPVCIGDGGDGSGGNRQGARGEQTAEARLASTDACADGVVGWRMAQHPRTGVRGAIRWCDGLGTRGCDMAVRGVLLDQTEAVRASKRGLPAGGGPALFPRGSLVAGIASVLFTIAAVAAPPASAGGAGESPLLRPPDLTLPEPMPAPPSDVRRTSGAIDDSVPPPLPPAAPPSAPVLPPAPAAAPAPPAAIVAPPVFSAAVPAPPLPGPLMPKDDPLPAHPAPGSRLAALPGLPAPLGMTPEPTVQVREKLGQYVDRFIDPEATLDLIVGRTRLLVLKNTPKRVQIAQEGAVDFNLISGTELLLQGKTVGNTSLSLWFPDPNNRDKVVNLTYLVRVFPDPEAKDRLDRVYKALEGEINRFFPESHVELSMLGDKLVVTGVVKDVAEGTQILRIIHANAPGGDAARLPLPAPAAPGKPAPLNPDGLPPITLENFQAAGGPNVVNLLRVPGEQQVMLHVVVAEMDRTAARSIGLNFNITDKNGVTVFSNTTGPIASPFGLGVAGANTGINFANSGFGTDTFGGAVANLTATLDGERVPLAINALRNLNYAKSMAEPTLVTLNGQTADFQAGGQFPVPIVTGYTTAGLEGVQFVPYGVQLSFTPYITDRDRIRLAVSANVSSRDVGTGTNIGGAGVPGLTTRNFNTTVELREGETMAVAGLIQSNQGAESSRLPFAGLLPIVGPLTGLTMQSAGEQELVILVTPELAHPLPPGACPPLPGADLFEPNDVEFYLLGRIESHCPRDYRSPIRTDWSRVMQYRRMEDTYISGPTGYSPNP